MYEPAEAESGRPFCAACAVGPPMVISTPPSRTQSASAFSWSLDQRRGVEVLQDDGVETGQRERLRL